MSTDQSKEKSFLARLVSEDPSASSQRFAGILALIVGLTLACFQIPTFTGVLYFAAFLLGVKEARKAIEGFKPKIEEVKQAAAQLPATKPPELKKDEPPKAA